MALKRNEVPTPATAWRNLEDIMQIDRIQSQKIVCSLISFTRNVQNRRIQRHRVNYQLGETEEELLMDMGFLCRVMKCSKIDVVVVAKLWEYIENH